MMRGTSRTTHLHRATPPRLATSADDRPRLLLARSIHASGGERIEHGGAGRYAGSPHVDKRGLAAVDVEAKSSRSLSMAAIHLSASGHRRTRCSDVAPGVVGVALFAVSWSGRISNMSAPPLPSRGRWG